MASSFAFLVSIGFLSRFLLRPMRPVAASMSHYFGSSAVSQHYDGRGDRGHTIDHHSNRTMRHHDDLFSDVFDLFYPTRSLSEVLNLMDQFTNNPFPSTSRDVGAGFCVGWDAKKTDDALHLQVDMPVLDKEDVKVSRCSSRIDLPKKLYKFDKIMAEMKNGMPEVVVPQFKRKDRNDMFQVKIE